MAEQPRNTELEDVVLPVSKIGDGLALMVPKALQERLNLQPDDELHVVELNPDGVTLSPHNAKHWKALQIAARAMVKYAQTLKALAK